MEENNDRILQRCKLKILLSSLKIKSLFYFTNKPVNQLIFYCYFSSNTNYLSDT